MNYPQGPSFTEVHCSVKAAQWGLLVTVCHCDFATRSSLLFRDPSTARGGTERAQAVPSQHHPRVGAGISRTGRLHLCDAIPSTFALIWVGWANCRVLMDVGAANSPACGRRVNSLGTSLATNWIDSYRLLREPKHGTVLRTSCKQSCSLFQDFSGQFVRNLSNLGR